MLRKVGRRNSEEFEDRVWSLGVKGRRIWRWGINLGWDDMVFALVIVIVIVMLRLLQNTLDLHLHPESHP